MPIYAYRCAACGHAKDVLQKLSDPLLSVCPSCGAVAFAKQVTAAGIQFKGSGWYVTDFRGGSGSNAAASSDSGEPLKDSNEPAKTESVPAPAAAADSSSGDSSGSGGGGGTACH